jgi:photosystem II stability/assembly factor-like uncharacterized protein
VGAGAPPWLGNLGRSPAAPSPGLRRPLRPRFLKTPLESLRTFRCTVVAAAARWQPVRSFALSGEAWLSFPSKRDGFLGDDRGRLYGTGNGGRTWRTLRYPEGVERGVFLSRSEGLAITDAGLLATADGGLTWKGVPVRGPTIAFRALGAFDRQHIWVGGLDETASCNDRPCRGLLLRTSYGGRRWTLIRLPSVIGVGGLTG